MSCRIASVPRLGIHRGLRLVVLVATDLLHLMVDRRCRATAAKWVPRKPRTTEVAYEDLFIRRRFRVRIRSNADYANLAVTAIRNATAQLDERSDASDDPWAATQSNVAALEVEGDISQGWSRSSHDRPQLPIKVKNAELRGVGLVRTPLGEVGMAVAW